VCERRFGEEVEANLRYWNRESARESGFDRKNFVRKLIRDIPVKRNSYNEFVRWLQCYKLIGVPKLTRS
jgi:hypothetical protein